MRSLSQTFLDQFILQNGLYHHLLIRLQQDHELDFQIRDRYINIYYKGHSILKLKENGDISIHKKFLIGCGSVPKKLSNLHETDQYSFKHETNKSADVLIANILNTLLLVHHKKTKNDNLKVKV